MKPMRNDPRYHRGPCFAPTLDSKDRVKDLIAKARDSIKAAKDRKD